MSEQQIQLDDGRRWNGLAYVHDTLVPGCNCASCLGYFQVPVTGVRADGSRVWYTGKAGDAFVSENPKDAFLGYRIEGAQNRAKNLNRMTALHGIRFVACCGYLAAECAR